MTKPFERVTAYESVPVEYAMRTASEDDCVTHLNAGLDWAEGEIARLKAENAKLRELVDGLRYCANEAHGRCTRTYIDEYVERCPLYGDDNSYGCIRLMRELGIEADG